MVTLGVSLKPWDAGDYLVEELLDEIYRGDVPIYRGLINLRELQTTGLISPEQTRDGKKKLNRLIEERMEKA
jgi:hypothetical protein